MRRTYFVLCTHTPTAFIFLVFFCFLFPRGFRLVHEQRTLFRISQAGGSIRDIYHERAWLHSNMDQVDEGEGRGGEGLQVDKISPENCTTLKALPPPRRFFFMMNV